MSPANSCRDLGSYLAHIKVSLIILYLVFFCEIYRPYCTSSQPIKMSDSITIFHWLPSSLPPNSPPSNETLGIWPSHAIAWLSPLIANQWDGNLPHVLSTLHWNLELEQNFFINQALIVVFVWHLVTPAWAKPEEKAAKASAWRPRHWRATPSR